MKKNILYNVIYQILVLLLPLITIPYVSRTLGADGIGKYSYIYSIVYYFMMIAMLGLNNYGNRTIAKVRDDKEKLSREFCSIYVFQIISTTTMIVSYLAYVIFFNNEYKTLAFIQSMYVISTLFDINWFFFGIEKFKLTITRNTIIKILALILIFVFVKTPTDVWKYTVILAGSTLLSNIVLFPFLHRYIKFTRIKIQDVIKHLKPCIILFLPVIAISIYKMMDKTMLGKMGSVVEVGYYENAEKITQVPLAIITAIGTVMLPRVSNMLSKKQEDNMKNIIMKTMQFSMFATLPMFFGLCAISRDFAVVFLGEQFAKSGILIQLLSITIVFLAWGNVIRTQFLIPKERDREYVISACLGAIVNFIVNYILIPKYASVGACIGTIVAEFFVMFYQSIAVRHELPIKLYIKNSIEFLFKSIIMFIMVIVVGALIPKNKIGKISIQIITGTIIYGLLNLKYILNNFKIKLIMKRSNNI